MATVDECRQALAELATKIAGDPTAANRVNLDRSLACQVKDLNVAFRGRLHGGAVTDLADGDDPKAQIRLTISSDDLVALVAGRLNFAAAWASGRASVKASFSDLLRLRKLL
jgi:hypothetical protein